MHALYTQKLCNKCEQSKPLDSFKPNKRNVDGKRSLYRKSGREKHMISRYGIDFPTFRLLKQQQGNKCKLCERAFPEGDFIGKVAAIDHCHVTGEIRGILCIGCNTALGRLGDNESGLLKALKYVKGEL